jgi:prevent-host-death family protein
MSKERVSVSQLKESLASYLDKVKAGRSLLISDRGIGVAVLTPVSWHFEDEAMRGLVLSGQVTPPSEDLPDVFFRGPTVKDPDCSIRRFPAEEPDDR